MNIAIIGMGGVGGYFGGKLTRILTNDNRHSVYFVARGAHLEAIRQNGLKLFTDEGDYTCEPTIATDDLSALPILDFCLICVKSYDLQAVLSQLKPKIAEHTIILPLLNGVDIVERICSVISNGVVLPACVYVGTHIESHGVVRQKGGTCTIHFGKERQSDNVDAQLFEILDFCNIRYNFTEKPYTEIWSKYIFIAGFGLVTAATDKTIGQVLDSPKDSGDVLGIMREIYCIASQKQIELPADIVEISFNKGSSFAYETKTSFQRDFEKSDKPDERDLFGGTILRMGKTLGIKTPFTKRIYSKLEELKRL